MRKVLDAIKKMAETEVKCEDKEGEVRQECMWVGLGVSYPKMLVFQASWGGGGSRDSGAKGGGGW